MAVLCRTTQLLQPFADALASLGVASRIQGGGGGGGGGGAGTGAEAEAGREAVKEGKPAKGRRLAAVGRGAVTLSTIHRAKGLEWQVRGALGTRPLTLGAVACAPLVHI